MVLVARGPVGPAPGVAAVAFVLVACVYATMILVLALRGRAVATLVVAAAM
jgi:hypothetical protein